MTADSAVVFELEDGRTERVEVKDGQTILEAADEAGLELRSGCRQGQCTSCTGKLLDGDVEYVETPKAVDDEKRAEGYVSLCISRPDGECRIAKHDGILVEAFPRVWQDLDVDGSG